MNLSLLDLETPDNIWEQQQVLFRVILDGEKKAGWILDICHMARKKTPNEC